MRREDRRKSLLTWSLLAYSENNEVKHRIWAPPKKKIICAFEHYLSQEWFVYDCLYRIALTSHEVNCYSNWPTLHRMMTTTFNSQHVFHNYPQHELVVSAHSENITFGHNWVLPADRHGPTTRCYHTDAPRHPFDRISRWLLCCTCTASNFLIREVYGSRWSERSHEFY